MICTQLGFLGLALLIGGGIILLKWATETSLRARALHGHTHMFPVSRALYRWPSNRAKGSLWSVPGGREWVL